MIKTNSGCGYFWDGGVSGDMPKIRYFGNSLASLLIKLLTGNQKINDPLNGLFLFSENICKNINIPKLFNRYGYPFFINAYISALNIGQKYKLFQYHNKINYGLEESKLNPIVVLLKLMYFSFSFFLKTIKKKLRFSSHQLSGLIDIFAIFSLIFSFFSFFMVINTRYLGYSGNQGAWLAQSGRALPLQGRSHRFKSCSAHKGFFISGYLISNKIITELNHKNFSFKNFYIKRIKRILPSIISMSLFSLPLAFILLPPKELYFFISSVISSIFFYSNIYFENFDFYNSPSSKYIPFLHMWSLSVEEQFYLILPLILFFVFKKKKNKLIISIFSIFLFSITLNIFSEFFNTFYQIQFRFWEFLFGVLFNFLNKEISISKVFKVFGFGIILLSLLIFDDILINILYPKLIALIGVFIFLIKSDESVFFDNLFNNSFIKYTGFISYSLYLFHQPVFSFFRIYEKNIKKNFSIKDLENISGIKAHTIRIWEKRYSLLSPERTETNIRHYSHKNLQRPNL